MSSEADELHRARAYLLRVAEPPAPALARFVDACGPIEAAARVTEGAVPQPVADETEARRGRTGTEDFDKAAALGARLIVPEDPEWPAWPLLALNLAGGRGVKGMVAPLALWARGGGRLDEAVDRAVTVVGSRASTGYGEYTAADWSYTLAREDVAIFSGAAYGIDASAHRGALAAEGVTVAALGCGLDAGYPAGHDALLRHVAERGVVLSEYPPGTPPARHRFLVRNRLLAALSSGTLVVEADVRSGARNTANSADALGRPVMAVPGPITSRSSAGCHEMIRSQQASLVTSAGDVLEVVGRLGIDLAQQKVPPARETDGLSGPALKIHDALDPRQGKSVERLAAESGVPERKVRSVLPALEVDGLSERCESGWRQAARP